MTRTGKKLLPAYRQLSRLAQAMGIIAYAGLQWLVLLRLLPIGGYELVGSYALAQAVVAPIVGFFAFSMRPLWVSGALGEISAGSVLAIRITMGIVASAVSVVVTYVFGMRFDVVIFTYVISSKFLETISDILSGNFDRQGKSATSGFLLILKSAVLGLVILVGWVLQLGLSPTLAVLLIAQVSFVAAEWKMSGASRPSGLFHLSRWSNVLPWATAFFAAVNSLVASIAGFMPRYLLEFFADRETVGYFSTIYIPVLLIQMIATGLSQTHLHHLSKITRAGGIRPIVLASLPVALLIAGLHIAITISVFVAAVLADWGWESRSLLLHDMALILALSLPLGLRQYYSYVAVSTGRMTAIFVTSLVLLGVQGLFASWAIRAGGVFGCIILMSVGAVIQMGAYLWILHGPDRRMAECRHG